MTAAAPRPAVGRAAFIGVLLSCLVGGGFLVVRALTLLQVDCNGLAGVECASAKESASQLSRTHAAAGLALFLIGGGLMLWARSKSRGE
ncbi:MAG: hypothetical protein QM723_17335 [Myxococcaceae bacterium]